MGAPIGWAHDFRFLSSFEKSTGHKQNMDTPGEWARRWTVGPREISRPGRDVSRIIQISTSANHSTCSQGPLTLTSLTLSVTPVGPSSGRK